MMKPSTFALVAMVAIVGIASAIPAPQDAVVPENALLASKDSSECKTDGAPCVFPYTWNGKEYNRCIADDWHRPWCGTGGNPWIHYAHCLDGCESGPELTADPGPEPDGTTAPPPEPESPEAPDCEKSCCKIRIYKFRNYKKKVKTIKRCSYSGERPYVNTKGGKIRSFKLSGSCEKVKLWDDDDGGIKKKHNKVYTKSKSKLPFDLRNDVAGIELHIQNKNTEACKVPGA